MLSVNTTVVRNLLIYNTINRKYKQGNLNRIVYICNTDKLSVQEKMSNLNTFLLVIIHREDLVETTNVSNSNFSRAHCVEIQSDITDSQELVRLSISCSC